MSLAPQAPPGIEPRAAPPTFSIVIAAYQAAATIAEAVASALAQTHPALEVIVVDDGSTDDLVGALRPFGSDIKLIHKRNAGGASARNAGTTAARGEFIAILDADDVYDPRRLEVIAELARQRPDLDLVTTDARFIVEGEPTGTFLESNPFATEDQRSAILESAFLGGWPAVRVSSLQRIGGFDEEFAIAYDWDCWLRLIYSGSAAGLVPVPYYDYRLHPGSLAANRAASLWERVRLLRKARAQQEQELTPAEKKVLADSLRLQRRRAVRARLRALLGAIAPWRRRGASPPGGTR